MNSRTQGCTCDQDVCKLGETSLLPEGAAASQQMGGPAPRAASRSGQGTPNRRGRQPRGPASCRNAPGFPGRFFHPPGAPILPTPCACALVRPAAARSYSQAFPNPQVKGAERGDVPIPAQLIQAAGVGAAALALAEVANLRSEERCALCSGTTSFPATTSGSTASTSRVVGPAERHGGDRRQRRHPRASTPRAAAEVSAQKGHDLVHVPLAAPGLRRAT